MTKTGDPCKVPGCWRPNGWMVDGIGSDDVRARQEPGQPWCRAHAELMASRLQSGVPVPAGETI